MRILSAADRTSCTAIIASHNAPEHAFSFASSVSTATITAAFATKRTNFAQHATAFTAKSTTDPTSATSTRLRVPALVPVCK